jgi:hypothetical protein
MIPEPIDCGVCRLTLVPVRKTPADTAEQLTQLLFGDHYEVLESTPDSKWLRIRIVFDQYEGWIDSKQHHSVSREYFNYSQKAEFKITTDLTSGILYNKSTLLILMGSVIPISSSELFKMEEQFAFNGEAKNLGQKREFEFMKTIAQRYLHAPYVWGGKSPVGIDCSGLVQMVFKICGYPLLRDAVQQSKQGREVPAFDERRPGDLAFFRNDKNKITHVGLLLDGDKIIHSSGKVRIDLLTEAGIVHSESRGVTHVLSHLRRVLAE